MHCHKLAGQRIDPYILPTHFEVVDTFAGDGPGWYEYAFTRPEPVYEQLTVEYVTKLAEAIIQLASGIEGGNQPTRVVEVGAGVGRLSHCLRAITEGDPIEFIATDSGEDRLEPIYPVTRMGYGEALSTLAPEIVLCSWMPYKEDWSAAFRSAASVRVYVLIGETRFGCVGADETWNPLIYEGDGFTAKRIDCGPQINRMTLFDNVGPGDIVVSTSSTMLFQRQSDPA